MPLREDFRLPVRRGYAVCAAHGVWRSLVARFVRDEEVVGSNPATPTVQWPPSQMAATSRWNRASTRTPKPAETTRETGGKRTSCG